MAAHSNRSPSPLSYRRPLSDFSSIGIGCDEKENDGKDHNFKASKLVHSPAKGCKKFMAPTISAASKFTPSPRKKVLVDRNDPVRTSISLPDGKADILSSMSSCVSEESKKRVAFSDKCSESLSELVMTESGSSKLDSGSRKKIFGSSNLPSIAPLDADPSMPVYGPNTDYLSPGTKFLHYIQNPRIEILLNKEKEVDSDEFKWLEDNIMLDILSENFTDSIEEPHTEEVTASDEEEETEECVSEPSEALTISKTAADAVHEKHLVQEKGKRTLSCSRLWRFLVLTMFLMVCGSISITYSPGLNHEVLSLSNLSSFHHQAIIAASVKAKVVNNVARRVSQFSVDSLSFISKHGKGDELGPLQFVNLLDFQVDSLNEGHLIVNKNFEETLQEDELEETCEEDESDENFEEELDMEEDDGGETEVVAFDDSVKITELEKVCDKESKLAVAVDGLSNDTGLEMFNGGGDINDHGSFASMDDTINTLDQKSSFDFDSTSKVVKSCPVMQKSMRPKSKFIRHYTMGVSSLFISASIAFAAYLYINKARNHPNKAQTGCGFTKVKSTSQNWQQTEAIDDIIGGESPSSSEMSSSCQCTTPTRGGASEVQRTERIKKNRKHSRRESTASSSEHAPSYGSFTSFQRIPVKNVANGDQEEVVTTPVRRSSRIRYHHHMIAASTRQT